MFLLGESLLWGVREQLLLHVVWDGRPALGADSGGVAGEVVFALQAVAAIVDLLPTQGQGGPEKGTSLECHSVVAVGTALSGGPPHRSQRAGLPHWAPASGDDAHAA